MALYVGFSAFIDAISFVLQGEGHARRQGHESFQAR